MFVTPLITIAKMWKQGCPVEGMHLHGPQAHSAHPPSPLHAPLHPSRPFIRLLVAPCSETSGPVASRCQRDGYAQGQLAVLQKEDST